MKTITIHRVEHREEYHGPYLDNDRDTYYEIPGLHQAHGSSKSHPGPRMDEEIGWAFGVEHSFGFGSREQLDKWFKGFKRKLAAKDFVIRVYEAPFDTTTVTDHQAIFIRDDSRLVDTLPMLRR